MGNSSCRQGLGVLLGLLFVGILPAQDLGAGLDEAGLDALLGEEIAASQEAPAPSYLRHVSRTPSNVFTISREQIEAVNPQHPAEMLRFVPGFSVLRRQQNSYEISAFGTGGYYSNKVLVLVDGHRVTSPLLGNTAWHMVPLVQDDVERIEVTLGPESTGYGSNAFAAVVNFVTRSPDKEGSRVVARSGADSYHQLNWLHTVPSDRGGTKIVVSSEHKGHRAPWQHVASGQIDPTFPSGDRFTQTMVKVDHQRDLDEKTALRFSAALTESQVSGALPGAYLQQAQRDADHRRILLGLNLDHHFSPSRYLAFRGTFQRDIEELGAAPLALFGVMDTLQASRQAEADLRYHWEPGSWKFTTGANLRSYGVAGPYNRVVDSQETTSVFAHGEKEIGEKLVLFLGARSIFQETANDVTAWKVAGLYRARPDLGFRLSLGTSFREPDFVSLFFRTTNSVQVGGFQLPLSVPLMTSSGNLDSERSKGFLQFGIEKSWRRDRVKLDFYRTELEGSIVARTNGVPVTAFIPPGGPTLNFGSQFVFGNGVDIQVRGITLAYERELPRDFQLQLGLNVQDMDTLAYPVADAGSPPRSASLLLTRKAEGRRLGGSLAVVAVDSYGLNPNVRGPGYGTVDLNLERRLDERASVLLTVRNLFDREHYETATNLLGAARANLGMLWGRDAYLTVRYDL